MLPELPLALNPDFANGRGAPAQTEAPGVDHMCQICPTCSHTLEGHRCKLVCRQCGYYMSCADYY